ncbi:MAG: AMP-binding protein, partial [Pseudomonadota bacterium]
MKFDPETPPKGTLRDWIDARAGVGGVGFVFPETGEALTWEDLRAHCAEVAGDLTAQGIAKGESVAVMHPNGLSGVKALYAALYGGFRVTMLNLAAGPDALRYAMEHSQARAHLWRHRGQAPRAEPSQTFPSGRHAQTPPAPASVPSRSATHLVRRRGSAWSPG